MAENSSDFYDVLNAFDDALEVEAGRLGEEELPKGVHRKQTVAGVKLLDLLTLTKKKTGKLLKIYDGDPTPELFPNEEGGAS